MPGIKQVYKKTVARRPSIPISLAIQHEKGRNYKDGLSHPCYTNTMENLKSNLIAAYVFTSLVTW